MTIIFLELADSAGIFIELSGNLGAGMIGFSLPGIIYVKVFGFDKIRARATKTLSNPLRKDGLCAKIGALIDITMPMVTVVIGTLGSLGGFVVTMMQVIKGSGDGVVAG